MFFPEGQIRVHVYGRPVDLRNSFDGLYALTRHALGQDPLSGQLFASFNRRATHGRWQDSCRLSSCCHWHTLAGSGDRGHHAIPSRNR